MKYTNEAHLEYVRKLSCVVCAKTPVDPHHLQARGTGEHKRNDYFVLPLCREHHSEVEQIGVQRFEKKYAINLWKEVARIIAGVLILCG